MENLKALVFEKELTAYQRALAQREFKDTAERIELLEKAVKNNAVLPHVSGSAFDIKEVELFHFAIIKALPHTNKKTNGYEAMIKTRNKLAGLIKEHYR
jgi:translation elongation factor EF-G